ncbi:ankyrin repeats (3 copies) domain-containing protein [Apiospora hydei]|uniref:Ankyrin repeats (3 copies) domain-containing protein n=1 Tax=Apiospora hydei TaxID=1337664 RepID=A0ABR1WC54_9PEZI
MLQLPTELLLEIGAYIDGLSDLLHFGLTCRGLSSFFLDELYSRDVRDGHCWALQWACRTGNLALAKRSLDAGAPVDHQFFDRSMANWAPWPFSDKRMRAACLAGTPLSVAVQHRHLELVRFLLEEKGANPNQVDKWAASYHGQIWYPIHWAVACQAATQSHDACCKVNKQCCGFATNPRPPTSSASSSATAPTPTSAPSPARAAAPATRLASCTGTVCGRCT